MKRYVVAIAVKLEKADKIKIVQTEASAAGMTEDTVYRAIVAVSDIPIERIVAYNVFEVKP